jgi:hypothetical protein
VGGDRFYRVSDKRVRHLPHAHAATDFWATTANA